MTSGGRVAICSLIHSSGPAAPPEIAAESSAELKLASGVGFGVAVFRGRRFRGENRLSSTPRGGI